jgi:hypothetical protein
MHPVRRVLAKFAAQSPKTYPELRDFVEKEQLMKDAGLKLDRTFGVTEGQTGPSIAI